jgi:hypothetical protein
MEDEGSERDTVAEDSDGGPTSLERIELPDHASAYYSPVPPPAVTQHQTIETEAVRLDPDLAEDGVDGGDTVRVPAHQLPSAADRNAPTVMLRALHRPAEPHARRRAVLGVLSVVAVMATVTVLLIPRSRNEDVIEPSPSEQAPAAAVPSARPLPPPVALPSANGARPAHTLPAVSETEQPAKPAAPVESGASGSSAPPSPARRPTRLGSKPPPVRPRSVDEAPAPPPLQVTNAPSPSRVPPPAQSAEAPRSWLKTEAPKAWLK